MRIRFFILLAIVVLFQYCTTGEKTAHYGTQCWTLESSDTSGTVLNYSIPDSIAYRFLEEKEGYMAAGWPLCPYTNRAKVRILPDGNYRLLMLQNNSCFEIIVDTTKVYSWKKTGETVALDENFFFVNEFAFSLISNN